VNPIEGTAPVLSVRGISKSYGGLHAVKQISMDIGAGEVVALVGDNGAGKSSFIKMLSGVMPPDSGSILVGGREVRFGSPADARSVGIETLHQSLGLIDVFDVRENIFLGRETMKLKWGFLPVIDRESMRKRTAELLARIDLKLPSVEAKVRSMSGGQRQSVAIARAILFNARILIMDEPTAALGPQETAQVGELVKQLKADGIGIFLISHDIHDVFDLADRVCVMKNGQVVGTARTTDVSKDEVLGMIILGKCPPGAVPGPGALKIAA
jgi:D-xylose transport system ATP-binding protein